MMRSALTAALLTVTASAACAAPPELPTVATVDGDPIVTLLAPDRISAIDEPSFVPAAKASFMQDDELVVGVVLNGVAKAYSTWHLDRHEIVNDRFQEDPVAVTW